MFTNNDSGSTPTVEAEAVSETLMADRLFNSLCESAGVDTGDSADTDISLLEDNEIDNIDSAIRDGENDVSIEGADEDGDSDDLEKDFGEVLELGD